LEQRAEQRVATIIRQVLEAQSLERAQFHITFMVFEQQQRGVSEASISQVFSRGTARPLPTRKGLIQPKRQQRDITGRYSPTKQERLLTPEAQTILYSYDPVMEKRTP
jgi:hypothetical protein